MPEVKKNIRRYCLGSDKLHSINICLIVDDTVLQVFMFAREARAICVVATPILSDITFRTLDAAFDQIDAFHEVSDSVGVCCHL